MEDEIQGHGEGTEAALLGRACRGVERCMY